jgi:small subunit ribosomal protein S4
LVSHRHITINGNVNNIPSTHVKVGDVVGVREKSKSLLLIDDSLSISNNESEWLSWDEDNLKGTLVSVPTREQITENIKEQLIVELYSK